MARPEAYREITLEDVDTAILRWFDQTVDASVPFPQGRRQKVPVILSGKERWASAREDSAHRDKEGRLVLPVITLTRSGLDPNSGMSALGSNVPRLQVSRRISPKTRDLSGNRDRRDPLLSVEQKPVVYEVTTFPFPFSGVARYEFAIHAQYMGHMNLIIERILAELEFYDVPCFVASMAVDVRSQGVGPTPGELQPDEEVEYDERRPTSDFYVCGYMDGDLGSDSNIDEFTDQERIIRYKGSFTVPIYLLLNPADKREAVQVEQTISRLNFGDESSHFPDDPYEIELAFQGHSLHEKVRRRG